MSQQLNDLYAAYEAAPNDRDQERALIDALYQHGTRIAKARLGDMFDNVGEDAVAIAVSKTMLKLHQYKNGSTFSTYFYSIVLNECTDAMSEYLRLHDPKKFLSIDAGDIDNLMAENSSIDHKRGMLYDALDDLPAADQTLVRLKLEGYSNSEIATALALSSADVVAQKYHRITERLREKLNGVN